jgi:RimJ/RimL family protein N-acetyltransferase|tara:strand:- start:1049 stop:1465 length:417 start_codon:yes stop_codon:yes gene_type:complete
MIKLQPLIKEHLDFLLGVRNEDSTRNNLENNSIFTLEDSEKWFKTLNSPWYVIINDDILVGYIRTNGNEIGCDIHPNHRRNGYAREAYKLILKEMDTASLWVFDDNFAKILYQELGFKEVGEQKIIRDRRYIKMVYEK